jgi:hypothetical protein
MSFMGCRLEAAIVGICRVTDMALGVNVLFL